MEPLNVNPSFRPVKQRLRRFPTDQKEFIKKRVQELLDTGQIEKIDYPTWVANPVVVDKEGGHRMCVDFTSLNKAYPNDSFPLP